MEQAQHMDRKTQVVLSLLQYTTLPDALVHIIAMYTLGVMGLTSTLLYGSGGPISNNDHTRNEPSETESTTTSMIPIQSLPLVPLDPTETRRRSRDIMWPDLDLPWGLSIDLKDVIFVADSQKAQIIKITPDGNASIIALTMADSLEERVVAFEANDDYLPYRARHWDSDDDDDDSYHSPSSHSPSSHSHSSKKEDTKEPGPKFSNEKKIFQSPSGLALDQHSNIYVCDNEKHYVCRVTPEGMVSRIAGTGTKGYKDGPAMLSEFNDPSGLAVDKRGNIYIADTGNHRIRLITPSGIVTTIAGNGYWGAADGPGPTSSFKRPFALAIEPETGQVYVADCWGHSIRKITPPLPTFHTTRRGILVEDETDETQDWEVTTIAGNGRPGFKDGKGTDASFYFPMSIVIDNHCNVFVADAYNNRIRKINSRGEVTTIAGSGREDYRDGMGALAAFRCPRGLAIDSAETILVSDSFNHAIRRII